MKIFTLLTALFISMQVFAQDLKGYYITNSNERIEGVFKSADFNDAVSLLFKSSNGKDYNNLILSDIKEYGINNNEFKFEKHTVQIDISDKDAKNLSSQKSPEWKTETLFLNVVVDGNAKLYSYTKDYKTKFFFSTKNKPGEVSQLIYKKYRTQEGVTENVAYKQQLLNAVRCDGQYADYFSDIRYNKKELSDVIENYNKCSGSESVSYYNGFRKRTEVKYTAFAGVNSMNFGIKSGFPPVSGADSNAEYSFGLEAAYVFPSEKVEFFAQAEYEVISAKNVDPYDQGYNVLTSTYTLEGAAFNVFFGPRFNFLLNEKNKFFVDASFGMSFPVGIEITRSAHIKTGTGYEYEGDGDRFDAGTSFCSNFSVGYVFNNKFGLSLRYETSRDMLDDSNGPYKTDITRLGLNLRYTIN